MNKTIAAFTKGIIKENPVFVRFLGVCPVLAKTTTVQNGLGLGVSVMLVLICSNAMIALLRNVIPKAIRLLVHMVIAAFFVAALEMFMKAYMPALALDLGIFVPLIVVNCIVSASVDVFESDNNAFVSAIGGMGTGIGFVLAMLAISCVREVLGAGALFGMQILPEGMNMAMFVLPPGGFIVLGLVIGLVRLIVSNAKRRKAGEAEC